MPAPTTIEINGYVVREIRIRAGIDIADLAKRAGVQRASMANIELGHRQRVSPKVYNAILSALTIADRRVLLAHPHGLETAVSA